MLQKTPLASSASHHPLKVSSSSMERMSKPTSATIDLEDRDPNGLSQHLQVSWDEVFGEPSRIRSPEFAWGVSQRCFRLSRNCCYVCLSVLCAPLTAFCLGLTFACLSFEHIWCVNPCLRVWKISCAATRNFVVAFTNAIIMPCTGACGYIFSQIKIKTQQIVEEEKKDDVFLV